MSPTRRAQRRAFFLGLALTIIWTGPAGAKTLPIDDSGSQAIEPSVRLHWKTAAPARSRADNVMLGSTVIRVRINVQPWLRHAGRIYLVLPQQRPGPLTASWTTDGKFLPGRLQSGNRALVYAGRITTPFMEDVLTFQFSVDGSLAQRAFPVSYHFEMDEG